MFQLCYKSKRLEKVCTHADIAQKQYGRRMAYLIHQRVDELRAAESIEELIRYSIGRCHPLLGDRKGEYAMDLVHPYRLIFEQTEARMSIIRIMNIEDYH